MGGILGGGKSKSTSTQQSGYSALPDKLRASFDPLGQAIGQYTNPANAGVIDRFSPLAQTGDETAAFNQIRQGFTPTADSLQSDISMLMNPFDDYVINDINRQAQGDYSILKQNANAAGQLGSNRQMLGANDIEQTRLNNIGQFRQGQYNQALDQVFNSLIPSRQQDAQGMLGIGTFQRGLDEAQRMAPINALQAGTGMLGPFVAGGTGTSTQTSGGGGFLSGLGQLAGGIGTAYAASDTRLKENIVPLGEENGIPIYEFSYKNDPKPRRFIGVMAQDLLESHPKAVKLMPNGFYAVDYGRIGVKFREVEAEDGGA